MNRVVVFELVRYVACDAIQLFADADGAVPLVRRLRRVASHSDNFLGIAFIDS